MLNAYAPGIVSLRDALEMPNVMLELAYEIAAHDEKVAAALTKHRVDVARLRSEVRRRA